MNTWAIVLNIIIIILEVIAFIKGFPERGWSAVIFYTVLSNLAAALSSVVLLIFGPGSFTAAFRYLASCIMAMTFLVTTCILIPLGGSPKMLLLSGTGPYHHILCPVLCVVSYLAFETHSRLWAVPVIFTFAYGMIMLYLNHKKVVDGPYPFFKVNEQGARKTIVWMAGLICLITAISLAVMFIAR